MVAKRSVRLAAVLAVLAIAGCERGRSAPDAANTVDTPVSTPEPAATAPAGVPGASAPDTARAELIDRSGDRIGETLLTEADTSTRIAVVASGLPSGPKGFHIHETGRCDPPDFESAGGHFNPFRRQHGFDNPEGPHAGDLPSLPVREDGRVATTVVAPDVTLRPGAPNSLLREGGTALVIHAEPDDYRTDPAGQSGHRIACGVIERE